MNWQLHWSHAALATLYAIPWRQAARIDEALQHLALTGQGEVFRYRTDPRYTWRLRVPPYGVRFAVDPESGDVWIWYVFKL